MLLEKLISNHEPSSAPNSTTALMNDLGKVTPASVSPVPLLHYACHSYLDYRLCMTGTACFSVFIQHLA